jgi:hypothetical protein
MVKQSISKTWAKAKSTGERARSSSGARGGGSSGGYSSAASRVLQKEGGRMDDEEILIGSGGSTRPPLSNAGSGSGKSDQPPGEQQQQTRRGGIEGKQQARNGAADRLKNRSPSPIRHYLGRLSITKPSTDNRPQPQTQNCQQQQHLFFSQHLIKGKVSGDDAIYLLTLTISFIQNKISYDSIDENIENYIGLLDIQ